MVGGNKVVIPVVTADAPNVPTDLCPAAVIPFATVNPNSSYTVTAGSGVSFSSVR